VKKEGSSVDLACLRHCLGALVEDQNPNVAAGVLERLGRDDIRVPTAREIAVVLRSTLNSKLLPGESTEALDDSASRYRNEKAASVEVYRRNREIRDMEFRNLRDLLKPMAEKFGLKVETNLSDGPFGLNSIVKPEEMSESTPHGRFEHRQLTCQTPDGDRLSLCFDGVPEFRRPWPTEVPGLVAKGLLSVVFRGAQQAILMRQLELWFRESMTTLVFREPERFVNIDGGELVHALRVLSGDIYPGIPEPVTTRQAVAPFEDLQVVLAQRQALQRLRIPYAQAGRARQKDKLSLGMAMLKLVLELSPERAPYKILGTRFHEMMAIPMQKRHQFVAEETGKVTAFLRHSMKVVRRFDIRPNDSSGQVILFEIDAVMDCGAVRTTLRSDNSVRPRKVEVQSIEIVAPKDPLAQLRSPKGKRRRSPPK
jgi:hypothetical protein